MTDVTTVIEFSSNKYRKIVSRREMEIIIDKLNFLQNFFRRVKFESLQEKEVLFNKEQVSKGFKVIEQGKSNEYIYLVFKGKIKVLHDCQQQLREVCGYERRNQKLVVQMLHKGDVFGVSALDFDRGCLSECTYEAASN